MYFWKSNICSPSVGCARSKRQYPTVLQNRKSFRCMLGLRMDGLPALDLWDVVIELLRSTNSIKTHTTQRRATDARQEPVRETHPKPNKRETEMLSSCRMWTTFPQTHILLKASLSGTFFVKGRRPTMRHVSRTHRVALGCLTEINMDSKIQIKYVDTQNQLADMLTRGSFTRDEWC